jgi:hypothetical protein
MGFSKGSQQVVVVCSHTFRVTVTLPLPKSPTLQRQNAENLKQIFPEKEYIGASVPISTFMYLWANNIFPWWVCLFCWRKYVDWSWEYINRSKTHECGNWGWGRAIPRKGIYKRNCRCSVTLQLIHTQSQKYYVLLGWPTFALFSLSSISGKILFGKNRMCLCVYTLEPYLPHVYQSKCSFQVNWALQLIGGMLKAGNNADRMCIFLLLYSFIKGLSHETYLIVYLPITVHIRKGIVTWIYFYI